MNNSNQNPEDCVVDITGLRQQIDLVDEEIIQLILKRIDISSLIMKIKPQSQVIDQGREQAIANRYFEKLSPVSTMPKTKRLVSGIIGASKTYPD